MKRWHSLAAFVSVLLLAASCARDAPAISTILYVTEADSGDTLHLLTPDGSRRRALPEREVGYSYWPLSPDATRVLYSRVTDGAFHWWMLPLDGSDPVQVAAEGILSPYGTEWLHDGRRIVALAVDAATGVAGLYLIDPASGTARLLSEDAVQYDCSATDNRVAVLSYEEDVARITIVDADTGSMEQVPVDLGPVHSDYVAWSPDGRYFALLRKVRETEGGLLIVDAERGEAWPAGLDVANTRRYIACLRWSPDSSQLLFVSDREAPQTLSVLDLATGQETPLVEDISTVCPCWSPDGRQIAFIDNMGEVGGPVQVCVIDVATGRIVPLTEEREWKFNLMWGMVPAAAWAGSPAEDTP